MDCCSLQALCLVQWFACSAVKQPLCSLLFSPGKQDESMFISDAHILFIYSEILQVHTKLSVLTFFCGKLFSLREMLKILFKLNSKFLTTSSRLTLNNSIIIIFPRWKKSGWAFFFVQCGENAVLLCFPQEHKAPVQ